MVWLPGLIPMSMQHARYLKKSRGRSRYHTVMVGGGVPDGEPGSLGMYRVLFFGIT